METVSQSARGHGLGGTDAIRTISTLSRGTQDLAFQVVGGACSGLQCRVHASRGVLRSPRGQGPRGGVGRVGLADRAGRSRRRIFPYAWVSAPTAPEAALKRRAARCGASACSQGSGFLFTYPADSGVKRDPCGSAPKQYEVTEL
ncbi:hypothetical protein P7K49_010810 [Saguinus oedipus]|uniref:Uncharacterized protein n=1 Tax=Saguinus oedipus TaxID=9490 RepID=A0ABQ9VNW6_SAGOE|nr:hypothetical protein P7K49_010810 [Saguinus oedipus]